MNKTITFNQIRKSHEDYLKRRAEFDKAGGIISPIRAVVFTGTIDFAKFLIEYASLTEEGQHELWRSKSQQIGYLLACKELASGKIKTAWSICAGQDILNGMFDKEFGIHLALTRLFKNNPKFSAFNLWQEHNARKPTIYTWPIIFFGDNTMEEQSNAFIKRCERYYKGEEIE